MISIEQIRVWCNGTWVLKSDEQTLIENLVIDSRSIADASHSLFIALKTNLRDGHSFIFNAYNKGVRNFIVCKSIDSNQLFGANILLVDDTLHALQKITSSYRGLFNMPVIGITGSNGKTVVKEWLYQLLGSKYNIIRSPKSYNSQIGVPLSVWQLNKECNLGIFEAGISQTSEMQKLEPIIKPDIGIFTNIGEAHNEGFIDLKEKIVEKIQLFNNAKTLIFCRDYNLLYECIESYFANNNNIKLFKWSKKQAADLHITFIEKQSNSTFISAIYNGTEINITILFNDDASIENAINCWCVMLLLKYKNEDIRIHFLQLQPISMRMELKQGINDSSVINDVYNSDLTSLQIALNFLEQQKQHSKNTVILSDLLQVGKNDEELYLEVSQLINRPYINRFIGIGKSLYKNKSIFVANTKIKCVFYKSTDDFLKNFYKHSFERETILLKGARIFAFEKIGLLLEQKVHQTVMSVNLSNIRHNLNVFRSQLAEGVKTMAMVKAFAYGSGSFEIAGLLQNAGVNYLTVAYTDEGIELRKAGIIMPIMVMSPDSGSFDRMINWSLEPELFNFNSLNTFIKIAQTFGKTAYPVHIKLDTGMHRLGFGKEDIPELQEKIADSPEIKVASIFSHLAASEDDKEEDYTKQQAKQFNEMSREIVDSLNYKPMLHLCNSAAVMRYPSLHYNMVRLGIGLYGISSNLQVQKNLKPINELKTTIAQIKNIKTGENIGYGHHTIATKPMRIATICIGYADGYLRNLGNGNAWVLIHNKPAYTIGSICMDMCMVDITTIPEAKEGNDVLIFGTALPISLLAEWAKTIPYEIMTGISQRVKRVYINEE